MGLNLDNTLPAAWFEAEAARLTASFATLPEAANQWLAAALPRARAVLAHDTRVPAWQTALTALPPLAIEGYELAARVRVCGACDVQTRAALRAALLLLSPWRKGPFELFDVVIDAEWRSDWKWARVAPHLSPLAGRRVLDVGCGNGYFAWRMAGAGARLVLGLDPSLPALVQFAALRAYLPAPEVFVLPLACADIDTRLGCFDTVFSMGVLYHRRDAEAHLRELRAALAEAGELVLETLVVVDGSTDLLIPPARYCAMRNVWAVPSPRTVSAWLAAAGFCDIRVVDITPTTRAEQRTTAWMPHHSLADFLDAKDHTRTREGHPAPVRAVFVASVQ